MEPEQDVQERIGQQSGYTLVPFAPILQQILAHFELLENLKDKDVLEVGPGTRVDLMRFLRDQVGSCRVVGAGRFVPRPWCRHRRFIREHVRNVRLLDFFAPPLEPTYDLIYSRFVFEQHSIDPWILLTSRAYWAQFKKNDFRDFDQTYPASVPNLQAVFRRAWQTLKPGGLMVSLIGKRKYSALDRHFLEQLKPEDLRIRELGSLSALVSVTR